MEALCEAGLDWQRVAPEMRDRARKCAAVLGLLGCGPTPHCDESLIDITLVRTAWARRVEQGPELAPLDEDALEALVVAGFDPAKCPTKLRARAQKHASVLSALDIPVSSGQRDVLVSATLSRVQSAIDSGSSRMRLDPVRARPRMALRWGDLISVAALLLIASAVITPMVGAVRNFSQQSGCQAGMGAAVGRAFASYANDFRDSLPMASASRAGAVWWAVGKPENSNSANLFTLVGKEYAKTRDLACAGNASACVQIVGAAARDWKCSEEVSYSFQNMFAAERPRWDMMNQSVVVADRSSVIVRAMRGEQFNPVANSDNHATRGQNALLTDGHVRWMRTPVLANGDNIWLPRTLEEIIARRQDPTRAEPLRGTETPVGPSDAFLTP